VNDKYRAIQKDGLNFVCLYFLNYTWYANGTHQLLAYADDVNILGGSIHTLKENAEALVAATREIELDC